MNKLLTAIMIGSALLTLSTTAYSAKKPVKMEKCTGIVAPGKADGTSVIKGKKVGWILVPEGACEKLVGGKVVRK